MKFDNRNLRVNGFTPRRWASMLVVLVSLNANILQAGEQVDDLVLTEMQAVAIAVRDNPNLAQMKERYKAFGEVPSQVGSLPDLSLIHI